ncbi:MAG: hypothetical protein CR972_00320 [Candidatus Moraniibacteriota bacterium]|nr:MAG: hypothetical protein CR972_00320 [Candidatus Moranbacteria bacterium]
MMLYNEKKFIKEFFLFSYKQACASIFGASLLFVIIVTKWIDFSNIFLTRYDVIFICAILIQTFLILTKSETWQEVKVIATFHILATCMELFKTSPQIKSWEYPDDVGFFMIATVPLFTGFLYSSVGSYIARAWRIFHLSFTHFPPLTYVSLLASAIYINFFTHHFIIDIRLILFIVTFILFWKTTVYFTMIKTPRSMPLLLGFALIAFFLYIAENIGSYMKVWLYPNQQVTWHIVPIGKYGAWFLLIIVSFALIAVIYRKKIYKK